MPEKRWEKGDLLAGKYRIETVLGKGGMGLVLGARHLGLDEPVAIKILLPEMLAVPGMVERFVREARAAAKIQSPHVVKVRDVDVLPSGAPYLVMERLQGADLGALSRTLGSFPIDQAVRWVLEACEAIAEAHALRIVHRDLKPANLFLAKRRDGSASIKVLDFGISKVSPAAGEQHETAAGTTLGSPSYMSPEQMISARDVDGRTDLWALGAILYRLLTGVPPFRADSMPQLCAQVLKAAPKPPSALRPGVPPELEGIVLRCLEKDRTRRFGTAAELAEALRPFAGEVAMKSEAPLLREPEDAPASDDTPAHSARDSIAGTVTPARAGVRRSAGAVFAAGGALALLVVAVVASMALRGQHEPSAAATAAPSSALAATVAPPAAAATTSPIASAAPTASASALPRRALSPRPVNPARSPVDPFNKQRK